VVIHVIAEQSTIEGSGSAPACEVGIDGLIAPELVAELAASAKLVALIHPADAAPENGYVPSKALADFVRCRDLTCRWPGCDRSAVACDVDHTIPYAQGGLTHASNLKCYCRTHHLVKTFWAWGEKQLPDGTLILTSPTGHTYVTTPGSALLFPSLCRATGGIPAPEAHRDDAHTAPHPRTRPRPPHRHRTPTQPPSPVGRPHRTTGSRAPRRGRITALLGRDSGTVGHRPFPVRIPGRPLMFRNR
jgi:hypothetical protein